MSSSSATFSRRSQISARTNRFSEALALARAGCAELIDLSVANPAELGLGLPAARLAELLCSPGLADHRSEPFGLLSAREALSRELTSQGLSVPAQQIVLSAGTSEAYGFLFTLLCDPGDSVLVPEPSYPLLQVLAALHDVQLLPYRLAYDGSWHLDGPTLRSALDSAVKPPRAVLTVHPNNPTGSFLRRDELRAAAALGMPIISDEVFGEYALVPSSERAGSALDAAGETLVFRLAGLSKSLALPQLKLAYTAIAGPAALVAEACARLEHIADAYLSVASPVQLALPHLLQEGPGLRARIIERVRTNRAALALALDDSSANLLHSEGGWYAIVRVPATQDDESWCLQLLAEQRLVVQPGYFFDLEGGTFLVLSCLAEPARFTDGIRRLRSAL